MHGIQDAVFATEDLLVGTSDPREDRVALPPAGPARDWPVVLDPVDLTFGKPSWEPIPEGVGFIDRVSLHLTRSLSCAPPCAQGR